MSIALFNEPPRVSINNLSGLSNRYGLLLGFSDPDGIGLIGLVCLEDGSVTRIHLNGFTIDYRYNAETDRWMDVNAQEPAQEG